jgi:hypothetical protein
MIQTRREGEELGQAMGTRLLRFCERQIMGTVNMKEAQKAAELVGESLRGATPEALSGFLGVRVEGLPEMVAAWGTSVGRQGKVNAHYKLDYRLDRPFRGGAERTFFIPSYLGRKAEDEFLVQWMGVDSIQFGVMEVVPKVRQILPIPGPTKAEPESESSPSGSLLAEWPAMGMFLGAFGQLPGDEKVWTRIRCPGSDITPVHEAINHGRIPSPTKNLLLPEGPAGKGLQPLDLSLTRNHYTELLRALKGVSEDLLGAARRPVRLFSFNRGEDAKEKPLLTAEIPLSLYLAQRVYTNLERDFPFGYPGEEREDRQYKAMLEKLRCGLIRAGSATKQLLDELEKHPSGFSETEALNVAIGVLMVASQMQGKSSLEARDNAGKVFRLHVREMRVAWKSILVFSAIRLGPARFREIFSPVIARIGKYYGDIWFSNEDSRKLPRYLQGLFDSASEEGTQRVLTNARSTGWTGDLEELGRAL